MEPVKTFGQKLADSVALWVGSWGFILGFLSFLLVWIIFNTILLFTKAWDPYPFVFLNLILSTIAAIQAPLIMMSQNRQAEIDRQRSLEDHELNKLINYKLDMMLKADIAQLEELEDIDEKLEELGKE